MNKVKFLVAALLGVLFTACSEEENLSQTGKTGFLVSLAEDVKVESRSTPEELGEPVASQFNLKITNQVTGSELYNGSYTSDLIQASAGTYAIEATHGENQLLAVDAPYYKGTAEAKLADGESKPVNVECKVANALASVVFSDEGAFKFEDQFSECELNVLVAGNSALIDGVKSAYYRAGSTPTFEFRGILKDGGEEVVQTLTDDKFSDSATFAAGAHCVITLKIGAVVPGVKIEISKVEVNEVTVSETIPMKWLPKPKVKATGFDSNNTLAFVETEQKQAALNLDLSSALQDIKFKFNFEDEQFASLNKEKEYLLSTDKATIEQALGITLPSIGDKLESIDLSGLIAKLQTNAGVPTNNSIEIDVQANNRWSSDPIEGESTPNLKYTLTCNKPEFTVDAYPGNIWTKEFTVNALREEQVTSGDFTKLSSDMTYQYSADGQTGWTNLSDGMRQDQLQPGTTYYIRGLYRGKVAGEETEVKTYEALAIPNSSLDDGYTTTNPKRNNPLYTFNGGWIDTRNELTCHSEGVNAFYVSKSSTLPINDNGSTVAHMMVIGWGAGNSCDFGNKRNSVINNISSGLVCVGDYDVNSDAINAKEAYIRPTSLTFTYKASPYNGDEYLIEVTLLNITDGIETIIGKGTLQSADAVDSYSTQSIDINYDDSVKTLPVSHVRVLFKAGTKEDRDHLEDDFRDASVWEGYVNAYIIGSQFWLDSFHFNYDK